MVWELLLKGALSRTREFGCVGSSGNLNAVRSSMCDKSFRGPSLDFAGKETCQKELEKVRSRRVRSVKASGLGHRML